MDVKIVNSSTQQADRILISGWVILLALSLLYFGYCWGWWGRSSLFLQYLFQCNCPETSEEARYSSQVDVIVSACSHVNSRLLPSGDLLYVQEESMAGQLGNRYYVLVGIVPLDLDPIQEYQKARM